MAQVSATTRIYAYINSVWTLLLDVIPVTAKWGIDDSSPLALLAGAGEMKFRLKNANGQYTPGGPNALAGFKRGIPVKRVTTFENEEYVRFFGRISDIQIGSATRDKMVTVTALDWMDYAQRHAIVNPGILLSKDADDVMQVLIDMMDVKPLQTSFADGVYAFDTAMDLAGTKNTAYKEMSNIAFSEIAHIYLKKDKANGETLVMENSNTRHGWVPTGEIPLANSLSGFLLKEDGDKLLLETGDKIILNETTTVAFDSAIIENFDAPYGEDVINRLVSNAYPRRLDSSPQILFRLDEPIEVAPRPITTGEAGRDGERYENVRLEGSWANPDGGTPVGGRDIITPVATTDYLMNTAEDGSGSNITSDLVVRFFEGTDGFHAYLANSNTALGYVTQFNVRGTGIYSYNPIILTAQNIPSIEEFEAQTKTMNLRYRGGHNLSGPFTGGVVLEYAQPRTILKSIYFCANKSSTLMMAYLHTDVGDLRQIDIDELGINQNYYIQAIEDKYDNGLVWVKWILKEHPSIGYGGLTDVAMETGTVGDGVDFGALIRVSGSDVTERTFSAWIYLTEESGTQKYIISAQADTGGVGLYVSGAGIILYSNRHNSNPGAWGSLTTDINLNEWTLVTASYNHTSTSNVPSLYVNGTAQTLNTIHTPAGTLNNELGTRVLVGNIKTVTLDYPYPFIGQIYDARIYNRILTAAEVTTLYNSGTPSPYIVTDGLVFQAFAFLEGEAADKIDTTLTSSDRIFENVYRVAGKVIGTPTVRVAPT